MKNPLKFIPLILQVVFVFIIGTSIISYLHQSSISKVLDEMGEQLFCERVKDIQETINDLGWAKDDLQSRLNHILDCSEIKRNHFIVEICAKTAVDSTKLCRIVYDPDTKNTNGDVIIITAEPKVLNTIKDEINKVTQHGIIIIECVMMLALAWSFFTILRIVRSIKALAEGKLSTPIKEETSSADAYWLSTSLCTLKKNILELIAKEADTKVLERSANIELDIARNIQQDFLVSDFKISDTKGGLDVFAHLETCPKIGGDFYDIFKLDNAHVYLGVGDAKGTGIPATFAMVIAKTMIHNLIHKHRHTGQAITSVGNELSGQKAKGCISLFSAIINIHTGETKYALGGGIKAYIFRGSQRKFEAIRGEEIIPGEVADTVYSESEFKVEAQDTLIILSNAFFHLMGKNKMLIKETELLQILENNISETTEILTTKFYKSVKELRGDNDPIDDLTACIFRSKNIIESYPESVPPYATNIELNNSLQSLPELNAWSEEFNEQHHVPAEYRMPIALVLEEWFVNIVSYAYTDAQPHKIKVSTWVNDNYLWLRFEDDGIPYDPTARNEFDTDIPLEQRNIGGLGIHFIRQTMDIFRYKNENGKNIVTIMKHITPTQPTM